MQCVPNELGLVSLRNMVKCIRFDSLCGKNDTNDQTNKDTLSNQDHPMEDTYLYRIHIVIVLTLQLVFKINPKQETYFACTWCLKNVESPRNVHTCAFVWKIVRNILLWYQNCSASRSGKLYRNIYKNYTQSIQNICS